MTGPDIAARRLLSQGLAHPTFADPTAMVRWFGAVQAQDYLGSLWAIGCRLEGATEAAIEEAVAARTILRTWPMRGTVHFVPAEDARWMVRLLAARVISRTGSIYRRAGLADDDFARARTIVVRALEGGKNLARGALYARLEEGGIATGQTRGLHITGRLAHEGLICFGAREGKQPTFALLDEWAPDPRTPAREEALAELILRYFRSHGPATLRDFQWWTGLTVAETQEGLAAVRSRLIAETVGDQTYWWLDGPAGAPPPACHLLPPFDEFLVAYKDRGPALAHHAAFWDGRDHLASAVIVSDGRAIGTWKRTIGKNGVSLDATLAQPLPADEQARLDAAVRQYGTYLGLPATLASSTLPAAR